MESYDGVPESIRLTTNWEKINNLDERLSAPENKIVKENSEGSASSGAEVQKDSKVRTIELITCTHKTCEDSAPYCSKMAIVDSDPVCTCCMDTDEFLAFTNAMLAWGKSTKPQWFFT